MFITRTLDFRSRFMPRQGREKTPNSDRLAVVLVKKNQHGSRNSPMYKSGDFSYGENQQSGLSCDPRHHSSLAQWHISQTTDVQWSLFSSKSQNFGLGQTIWTDKFWGIWVIFGRFISTHFGTVSKRLTQSLFLQKTKPLYPNPKYLFGIWIWAAKN